MPEASASTPSEERLRYEEFAPSGEADWIAACCWRFETSATIAPGEHVIPPDGSVNLFVARPPSGAAMPMTVMGPSPTAYRTALLPGWRTAGIRLRVGAASALGLDARAWRGRIAEAPAFPGSPAIAAALEGLTVRVESASAAAEAVFAAADPGGLDEPILQAVTELDRLAERASVAEIARSARLGERQFRRRFRRATGLSPIEYIRLKRLRAACISMVLDRGSRLAEVAHSNGYADQAHFTRSVREVFAEPPKALSQYIGRIDHRFA